MIPKWVVIWWMWCATLGLILGDKIAGDKFNPLPMIMAGIVTVLVMTWHNRT